MSKQLTLDQQVQCVEFLKPLMAVVNKGFKDQYFYCLLSDEEAAYQLGAPFTHSKVRKVRLAEWGKSRVPSEPHEPIPPPPPPAPEPVPEATRPPAEDMDDINLWLGSMTLKVGNVEGALAAHRTNTADSLAEIHKQLDEVLSVTRRLAKVWNITD